MKAENSQLKSQVEATAHHRLNVVSDIYAAQDRHPEEVERANDVFGYGVLNVFNNPMPSTAVSASTAVMCRLILGTDLTISTRRTPLASAKSRTMSAKTSLEYFIPPRRSREVNLLPISMNPVVLISPHLMSAGKQPHRSVPLSIHLHHVLAR